MAFEGLTSGAVHLAVPALSLFTFPPSNGPLALPPQPTTPSLERPFNIDPDLYLELLSVKYPLTIAAVYATTVTFLNGINARRKNKPWRISKSKPFFWTVIVHNVFLAVYSAWTCWGMFLALKRTVPVDEGLVGVVDAMCKMQGPRGMSSAVTYDPVAHSWSAPNRAVKLLLGKPDPSDVGRLWNEGLGYLGWLFYLSKFYEVIDTLIILAKGKKSSLLQTYHHAGAMLCMWAGIRFMSPPIWMFVLVNSGIHALMYSYYTLSALGIRVPGALKRTLTTMQITQFVVGVFYALAHLFITYDLPMEKPYLFVQNISTALPTVTSAIMATASADAASWLKKLVLRAAGEEGPAENVLNYKGEAFGMDAVNAFDVAQSQEEIRYKWETATTGCVDTSGQAFAIYLNVLYLAPLTYLFVMFFIRSYVKKASKRRPSLHDLQDNIRESSYVAVGKVNRAVVRALSGAQGSFSDLEFAKGTDSDAEVTVLVANGKGGETSATQEIYTGSKSVSNQSQESTTATFSSGNSMTKSQAIARDLAQATQENISYATEKAVEVRDEIVTRTEEVKKRIDQKIEQMMVQMTESRGDEIPKSYAAVSSKGILSKGIKIEARDDETEEERRARELVERAYAAANSAEQQGDGASETISIETRNESGYEASLDETSTDGQEEERKMRHSSLFK